MQQSIHPLGSINRAPFCIGLADGRSVVIKLLEPDVAGSLYTFLSQLSEETHRRFAPHAFDLSTIQSLANEAEPDCLRFVALDSASHNVVAYMLFDRSSLKWEIKRTATNGFTTDVDHAVRFAPVLADDWQGSGLAALMLGLIRDRLFKAGINTILLWGGVQASNEKAIRFYQKRGFVFAGRFWHEGVESWDLLHALC